MPDATLQILQNLRDDGQRLFGDRTLDFDVLHSSEREASTVAKVAIRTGRGTETVFVKVFKPRHNTATALSETRDRVARDFEFSSRLHAAFSASNTFSVVRPIACYPEHLAIVTAESAGTTLLDVLERRATWWPSGLVRRDLEATHSNVGGWLSAFQRVEPTNNELSLDAMREYIDIRVRRLLMTSPPVLDQSARARVLDYFDRTAAAVDAADRTEVLTHADLAPSNILIDGDRVTVIDFAMVAPGGRYMDLARLYTQLEFLKAKPKFRPSVVAALQRGLLRGFDPSLTPDRPLFQLFVLQHLLCHMSNIARNPAPLLARLYNRHQLRLRQRWLHALAAEAA